MLNIQPKTEVPVTAPKGCGCGQGKLTVIPATKTLSESQKAVIEAIQRVNKRRDAIYKTQTRFFM